MQNKGFVRILAVTLFLISVYYLSFSFVTSSYSKKAKDYAQGNSEKYYNYIDSISGEQVWLGYTLKQCREKEINLGLDLKGGMNVILEISVEDILRSLSDYNTSTNFNKALDAARIDQTHSKDNYLDLFVKEFEKIDPNAKLSTIFSTYNLKDKIQLNSTNADVKKVLNQEINDAINNSFNVLRTRIDRFGVVQPNIQRLETQGRILVELPGIKEPERVRKLLQGSANLEFWETYKAQQVLPALSQANQLLREKDVSKDSVSTTETKSDTTKLTASTDSLAIDSLAAALNSDDNTAANQNDEKALAEYKKNNPLFGVLQPYTQSNNCAIGAALGTDTSRVNALLAEKQVKDLLPPNVNFKWGVKPNNPDAKRPAFTLYAIKVSTRDKRAPLSGDVITDASVDFAQYSNTADVNMKMNAAGSKTWARLTKDNIGNEIAIVLDGYVYSAPTVNGEITGGSSQITGNFTPEEAKDLANVLKSGKMPAPAHIVQEDVVGPSLGQEAINDGIRSFIIAFIIVLAYMIFYYGLVPGLIADGALILNVVFIFGLLASFQASLTLPGIAGIVLTLGTAVDANVLIYERIREEVKRGKNLKNAISEGYKNAFSAIADSNLTTLITGIVLAVFGTGPVKGFATTLIIGIITSFFTGVFITHLVYDRMVSKDKALNIPFTTKITRNWFQNTKIDFIGLRKWAYIISGSIILVGYISIAVRGFNQGIDFSGGRNYVVRFEQKVNADQIRKTLEATFPNSQTSVITMGTPNQVRVSTNYEIGSIDQNIDTKMEQRLYNGLKPYLNPNVNEAMFVSRYTVENGKYTMATGDDATETYGIESSQKVGPTIAADIKISAIMAIIFALIAIFLYILLRFRNYSYSVGGIVALAHDVSIILGVFSLFYTLMPFSMEVDQSFIAAILTVIGYSINDTVVIFDRIRENIGLFPKRDLAENMNNSMNETLSRTFSTSFSTFVVLLIMFLLGGETIRGFVFALGLGVLVGTYSSVFIASPIAYQIRNKKYQKSLAKK